MIPSSRESSELRAYAVKEWNADVAFLMREEKLKRGKEKTKAKKDRARQNHHFRIDLRRLFIRQEGAHR
jgi:hypothetical protein